MCFRSLVKTPTLLDRVGKRPGLSESPYSWVFQVSVLFIKIPRSFSLLLSFIIFPQMFSWGTISFFSILWYLFALVPRTNSFVLSPLQTILFFENQLVTTLQFSCIVSRRVSSCSWLLVGVLSSAKTTMLDSSDVSTGEFGVLFLRMKGSSFMNKMKRSGPKMEPWGTPQRTFRKDEKLDSIWRYFGY